MFKNAKGIIRRSKLKKNRPYNNQTKKDNTKNKKKTTKHTIE
jgi:hypothetical protein